MVDAVLPSFSYGAGVLSFFSPCAFPMRPAYISAYPGLAHGEPTGLGRGVLFIGLTVLGVISIFGILGGALGLVGSHVLGPAVPLFGLGMGLVLVALGILLLSAQRGRGSASPSAPREGAVPSPSSSTASPSPTVSVGCTFPLFLLVVTGAVLAGGVPQGVLVFLVYSLGLGTVMIFLSVAMSTSGGYFAGRMKRVLPYVRVLSAVLLIAIGAYMGTSTTAWPSGRAFPSGPVGETRA